MQKKVTTLIAEDEIPTQRLLKDMLKKLRPQWEIMVCTTSLEETLEWLENNPHPNIMFLDIQLSDGLSFEIFDQIKIQSAVVFTTAYDEYALKAFKVNSIDYLLKPTRPKELEAAILKYEEWYPDNNIDTNDIKTLASAITEGKQSYRSRLLVPVADGYLKLNVDEVACFHSSQKITTAYTMQGKPHIVDTTLEKLEEELDPQKFARANRQFILNINAIHRIENWFNGKLVVKINPEPPEKIVVSRERARSFKDWLNK
jgi:DNA-binding LytR/AlgR family response regulator